MFEFLKTIKTLQTQVKALHGRIDYLESELGVGAPSSAPPPMSVKTNSRSSYGIPLDTAILNVLASGEHMNIDAIMKKLKAMLGKRVVQTSVTSRISSLRKTGQIHRVSYGLYSINRPLPNALAEAKRLAN